MGADLTTTNVLLGIMATVSVLEAAAVLAVVSGVLLILRRVDQVVSSIEDRQIAPAMLRVDAILDDVKSVTATVRERAGHMDWLVDWLLKTLDRRRNPAHPTASTRVM